MNNIKFTRDDIAADRGRERYFIDYGDRDRLGSITLFQGEWHSDFRFNGKDFELRSKGFATAQGDVRTAIAAEVAK